MPGVYKLKKCPTCGKEHRKRGLHCGQSCANTGREVTQESREAIRQKREEYFQTPEGLANAAMIKRLNEKRAIDNEKARKGEYIVQADDFYIDIPDLDSDGTENIRW